MTLIELVLTIALIGIVSGVVAPIMRNGLKTSVYIFAQKEALDQTRLVMERISAKTRLMDDPSDIDTWDADDFRFTLPSGSSIGYRLNGTDLEEGTWIGFFWFWRDLASDVSALSYTYYDDAGNVAAAKADIHTIEVEITLDAVLSGYSGYGSVTTRTLIFPRRYSNAYANFD